ncbi:MAG: Rpn family recombination-promoting nuclease/putative transposase [Alistipes sp.]|nr:Rpn family recombination-promoting nuclease/putative transposase [Alistipes sp.]
MGQPNDVLNYYLQRNDRIAAICNYCVGEALFKPEDMSTVDGFYSVRDRKDKVTHIQRDLLRQAEVNGRKILVGIENQNDINLIFPFRQMEMDYLEMRRQIEQIRERNRNTATDDFMYDINETDKLLPVMDIVLYWGREEWKSPKTLMDMQDMENVPEELKPFFNDYHVNLVAVRGIPDWELDKMQSDIGYVIGMIKHSQSLSELKEYVESHKEGFRHFSKSAMDVVDVCAGIRALKEVIRYQENEGKEECDMCQAIDDLIRISTTKGKAEAVIELLERYGAVPQETVNRITAEDSLDNLKKWLFLAASVNSIEEFRAAM